MIWILALSGVLTLFVMLIMAPRANAEDTVGYYRGRASGAFGAQFYLQSEFEGEKRFPGSRKLRPEAALLLRLFNQNLYLARAHLLLENHHPQVPKDFSLKGDLEIFGAVVKRWSREARSKIARDGDEPYRSPLKDGAWIRFSNPVETIFRKGLELIRSEVLPPVKIPVGPVNLSVQGGAYQEFYMQPRYVRHPVMDRPSLYFGPDLEVSGFIEGAVSKWLLRAGVGSNLTVYEGRLKLEQTMDINENWIEHHVDGYEKILSGNLFAFVDLKRWFRKGWYRLLNLELVRFALRDRNIEEDYGRHIFKDYFDREVERP
jgi:hypothetical protein